MSTHISKQDDFVPVSDLQKAPWKFIDEANSTGAPVIITQRGKISAYLLGRELYETIQQGLAAAGDNKQKRKMELLAAIEEMVPKIIEKYAPEKIILFGSLATDQINENSDIDLIIIKKTNKRPLDRQKELLKLVEPRIATDFFIYTPTEFDKCEKEKRVFFVTEIKKKGRVLYEKETKR